MEICVRFVVQCVTWSRPFLDHRIFVFNFQLFNESRVGILTTTHGSIPDGIIMRSVDVEGMYQLSILFSFLETSQEHSWRMVTTLFYTICRCDRISTLMLVSTYGGQHAIFTVYLPHQSRMFSYSLYTSKPFYLLQLLVSAYSNNVELRTREGSKLSMLPLAFPNLTFEAAVV